MMQLESYDGKIVACNASMMIYQSVVASQFGSEGGQNFLSDEGSITSAHLLGLFNKTVRMLLAGLKPIWVFDGPVPPVKADLCAGRREQKVKGPSQSSQQGGAPSSGNSLIGKQYSLRKRCQSAVREVDQQFAPKQKKRTTNGVVLECPDYYCISESDCEDYQDRELFLFLENLNREQNEQSTRKALRIAKDMTEDAITLLSLLGVPIIIAPEEAEAQCAALVATGRADAVVSEDMDCLAFGGKVLLRGINVNKEPIMEIELARVLEELAIDMRQLVDLSILLGCDYCPSISGLGPTTALKLIKEHQTLEKVLEWVAENKKKCSIPAEFPYQCARSVFFSPAVFPPLDLAIVWTAPDEAQLKSFLTISKGFSMNKIDFGLRKVRKLAGTPNLVVDDNEEEDNKCPGMYKKQKIAE